MTMTLEELEHIGRYNAAHKAFSELLTPFYPDLAEKNRIDGLVRGAILRYSPAILADTVGKYSQAAGE